MIEARGVATVVIGLVRPHMESSKPPRGLWVPFPLGRPLGEPEDKTFQHRVLGAALALLARDAGPVVLEDFPEDAPSMRDQPGWQPQMVVPEFVTPAATDVKAWMSGLETELASVLPHWSAATHRFGRTTVGISRVAPSDWAAFAVRFLDGSVPESPIGGLSSAVVMRYIADDMKALYMEAVQAIGPQPSSGQINRWFWNHTLAAELLCALRAAALASTHTGFNTAGSRFLAPAPFVTKA